MLDREIAEAVTRQLSVTNYWSHINNNFLDKITNILELNCITCLLKFRSMGFVILARFLAFFKCCLLISVNAGFKAAF